MTRLVLTPEKQAEIVENRRGGATMKDAAESAGISWGVCKRWYRAGRLSLRHPHAKGADKRFAQFARDLSRASGERRAKLYKAAWDGINSDPRHALELVKFVDGAPLRRAMLQKARAEARIAQQKADGTFVDKHEVAGLAEFLATGFRADGEDPAGPMET